MQINEKELRKRQMVVEIKKVLMELKDHHPTTPGGHKGFIEEKGQNRSLILGN